MSEVINLGPFMVQYTLLIFFLSVIAGYIMISILSKLSGDQNRKRYLDTLFTSMMIAVLVWRFGPVLAQPMNLFGNPFTALLLVRGSSLSGLIGAIIACIYFIYKIQRLSLEFSRAFDYLSLGFIGFLLINNSFMWKYGLRTTLPWGISIANNKFHYHPLNIYNLLVLAMIIAWIVFKKLKIGSGFISSTILIIYGIGNMIISYLAPQHVLILGLSVQQFIDLILLGIGWGLRFSDRQLNKMTENETK